MELNMNRKSAFEIRFGCRVWLKLAILLLPVFACAQQKSETAISVAVTHQQTGIEAKPGAIVFEDQPYQLLTVPECLKGLDLLPTAMSDSNLVIPVTEGVIYFVTPLAGQDYSQENVLIEQGFEKMTVPSFQLFKSQKQQVGIFRKEIRFEKFRLGHIRFAGWAVPFIKEKPLASVTKPAQLTWNPPAGFEKEGRLWQGCPSIEKTGNRLWATWFSGGKREPDAGNYGIVSFSDDGVNWRDPAMVVTHADSTVRVMDTELWVDTDGRLWLFWTQNTGAKGFDGHWGTWAVFTTNPEAPEPEWSIPKRLCDGLMRNKPIILSNGEWLLPSYNWINHQSAVYVSNDKGRSWTLRGGPVNSPIDNFYEHMCVELKNGDIQLFQRNIQTSLSTDKGISWSPLATVAGMESANSRLYVGRLRSGRLLLIYNNDPNNKRKNLTAFLSDDDGKTWPMQLLLDERDDVSYPEAVEDESGNIFVVYDRSRAGEKEILMAVFTEADIKAGSMVSSGSKAKQIISKAGKK